MKYLHSKAKHLLDRYLTHVRSAVSRTVGVDPFEIERDVRDHVEMALDGVPEPVSPSAMNRVLHRLGRPAMWAPSAESTTLHGPRSGEDWRLAYLSFALVLLALALPPFMWIGLFGAFLCARASLADHTETGIVNGQSWLRMPALLVIYVPLLSVVLLWPAMTVRLLADATLDFPALAARVPADLTALAERIAAIRLSSFDPVVTAKLAARSGHYLVAPIGVWLVVLGLFTLVCPRPVALMLRPFVREGSHRFARALLLGGVLVCLFALVHGLLKLTMNGALLGSSI